MQELEFLSDKKNVALGHFAQILYKTDESGQQK